MSSRIHTSSRGTGQGQGMIEFHCYNCGLKITVSKQHAGKAGKCTKCGVLIHVPVPQQAPSSRRAGIQPSAGGARPEQAPAAPARPRPQEPVALQMLRQDVQPIPTGRRPARRPSSKPRAVKIVLLALFAVATVVLVGAVTFRDFFTPSRNRMEAAIQEALPNRGAIGGKKTPFAEYEESKEGMDIIVTWALTEPVWDNKSMKLAGLEIVKVLRAVNDCGIDFRNVRVKVHVRGRDKALAPTELLVIDASYSKYTVKRSGLDSFSVFSVADSIDVRQMGQ
jgi:hypothetical protein